jgi:Zn-dependent protease with chaperone function
MLFLKVCFFIISVNLILTGAVSALFLITPLAGLIKNSYEIVVPILFSFFATSNMFHLNRESRDYKKNYIEGSSNQFNENTKNKRLRDVAKIVKRTANMYRIKMPILSYTKCEEVNAWASSQLFKRDLLHFSSGALADLPLDKIEGLIAHELSHLRHGDSFKTLVLEGFFSNLSFMITIATFPVSIIMFVVNLLRNPFSKNKYLDLKVISFDHLFVQYVCSVQRKMEFRADKDAVKKVGYDRVVSILEFLKENNKSNYTLTEQDLKISTHPDPNLRILNIS